MARTVRGVMHQHGRGTTFSNDMARRAATIANRLSRNLEQLRRDAIKSTESVLEHTEHDKVMGDVSILSLEDTRSALSHRTANLIAYSENLAEQATVLGSVEDECKTVNDKAVAARDDLDELLRIYNAAMSDGREAKTSAEEVGSVAGFFKTLGLGALVVGSIICPPVAIVGAGVGAVAGAVEGRYDGVAHSMGSGIDVLTAWADGIANITDVAAGIEAIAMTSRRRAMTLVTTALDPVRLRDASEEEFRSIRAAAVPLLMAHNRSASRTIEKCTEHLEMLVGMRPREREA